MSHHKETVEISKTHNERERDSENLTHIEGKRGGEKQRIIYLRSVYNWLAEERLEVIAKPLLKVKMNKKPARAVIGHALKGQST